MITHDMEQRSDEWFHIRKGKVTGTGLGHIMGTPAARESYFYEMIAERLSTDIEDRDENPMARGERLEGEAIAAFEIETDKSVEIVGFAEDDYEPAIAISPDGLIGKEEAIEVKCMGGKNHVRLWFTDEIPKNYYWQAIQYFVVNKKLKTLYFVGYNPDIPVHPLHIIEMQREDIENDIKRAKIEQEKFIKDINEQIKRVVKL